MKDKIHTALAVLDWKARSYWLFVIGIPFIMLTMWALKAQCLKILAKDSTMLKPLAIFIINNLHYLGLAMFIFLIYQVISLFAEDWDDFHRRW